MGWLSGWNYRKQHTITGTTAGTQSNYQMKIGTHYDYSFPDGRFYTMSDPWTMVSGNPTARHGVHPIHTTNIVEANLVIDGSSRTYIAYDAHWNGTEVRLYYTDDLEGTWTEYSANPILGPGAGNTWRTPSVALVGGTLHMFLCHRAAGTIERWTSADGINFAEQEDVIAGLNTGAFHNTFIWLNPNDGEWYLYWRRSPGDAGGEAVMARHEADITNLAGEADVVVTSGALYAAYPTVMYRDSKYWLLGESHNGTVWTVRAFSSDLPTSGFTDCDDSPIIVGDTDNACPVVLLNEDGSKCYLFTNRDVANWYQDMREVNASSQRNYEVNLNGSCKTDFGDIRFTETDGSTEIDYWLESVVGGVATFWVKIDNIPEDPGTVTIYIYYNKSTATTTSDIDSTFIFGDDITFGQREDTWDDTGTVTVNSTEGSAVEANETTKREGLTRDDDYFYITYMDTVDDKAYLKKFNASTGAVVNSVEITDGTLYHPGGIDQDSNGYIWIPMAENTPTQSNPSKIMRYNKSLGYVDTICDSSSYDDDHWGAIAVDEDNGHIYIANWGTAKIYKFTTAGVYVSTDDSPPYADVQDMQYLNGYIYGNRSSAAEIAVWKISDGSAQGTIGVNSTAGTPHTKQGFCIFTPDKHNSYDADWDFYLAPWADGWSDSDKKKVRHYERSGLTVLLDGASAQIEQETTDYGPAVSVRTRLKFTGDEHTTILCDDWPDGGAEDLAALRYGATGWILRTRVGAGGANDDDTGLTEDTDYHIWELKWPSSSKVELDQDDVNVADVATAPSNGMHLGFQNWGSATTDIELDWVIVRKYVDPEPTHTSWGNEEYGEPSIINWYLKIG